MFLKIKNNFENIFLPFLQSFKQNLFLIVLALVFILNSGVCYVGFGASNKIKISIYLITLISLIITFIVTRDFSVFKNTIHGKIKISLHRLLTNYVFRTDVLSFLLVILISTLNFIISYFSSTSSNLNSFIGTILSFLFAFLIVQIYSKDTFFKVFSNTIFVLSIISLLFFAIINITKIHFNTSSFWSSQRMYDSYLYIFYDYSLGLSNDNLSRMMGIFWEPGLFANFLLISTIIELFYSKKINWIKIVVFFLSIILTKSTSGYFLLILIAFAFWTKKVKTNFSSNIIIIAVFAIFFATLLFYNPLFSFLAKIMPNIFGKMVEANSSLLTRIESPLYFLKLFSQKPFNGWGIDNALTQYNAIKPDYIDSATATFPYFLAAFGVFGIPLILFSLIGLFFIKKETLRVSTRILLVIVIFIISNTELQTQVLGLLCIYFYGIKECSKYRLKSDSFERQENSLLWMIKRKNSVGDFSSHIIGSVILKGTAIVLGFLTIPAFSSYYSNDSLYGAWLTIVSILTIILNFDFGITDGLKNRIIEAKKDGDTKKIKQLISNSYFVTAIVSMAILIGGLILIFTMDWNAVFNVDSSIANLTTIRLAMLFVILTICIELVLKNVVSILSANKKIVLANSMMVITNALLIVSSFILKDIHFNKILLMSILYLAFVSLPLVLATIYTFIKICPYGLPSVKLISKKTLKDLTNLGLRFFAIQLCNIVLWGLNDFFITNIFGPVDVVQYQKLYKLFSTIVSLYSIFQPTLWVYLAFANKANDLGKIKKLSVVAFSLSFILIIGVLLCSIASKPIFDFWLGDATIIVSFHNIFPFVIYGVLYSIMASVSVLCYSFEKLKSFTIISIAICIIKIPLIYLLTHLNPDFDWTIIMWINIFLIIPYILFPSIEIMLFLKKRRKEQTNGVF